MIRSAEGDSLPFNQQDVTVDGCAIEARICAEHPTTFLPSSGQLTKYIEPTPDFWLRVDSGMVEASEVSMYYDSMICKLIVHAPSRQEAIDKMKSSLDSFVIRGYLY
jgi:propionyl-CoA carboxylase alpha chain